MEWLKLQLENALKDRITDHEELNKTIEAIVQGATTEIEKSYVSKKDFDNVSQELSTTQGKMDEMKEQLKSIPEGLSIDEMKNKLKETETAFDNFKNETEKREKLRNNSYAVEKALRAAGAAEDALDLIQKDIDIENINIDDKGSIVNWDTTLSELKGKRKSLFAVTTLQTDKPGSQESSTGAKPIEDMSTEEYYNSIGMKPFNQSQK